MTMTWLTLLIVAGGVGVGVAVGWRVESSLVAVVIPAQPAQRPRAKRATKQETRESLFGFVIQETVASARVP